ncbi:hypothetical protein [Tropicibacter sp. S64]|uniref:hypothetical protein n=1 Tax=Tropicibacter sp. S64 TaxID=3415122 RepID=UPI003C7D9E56
MAKFLTEATKLTCPHGASCTVTATEQSVSATTGKLLKPTDSFTVSGCQFKIPAGPAQIPSPCTTVVWLFSSMRVQGPYLTQSSVGVCFSALGFPQGTLTIANPDPRAEGM